MLFNSLTFLVFLPLVFCAYWLLQSRPLRYQNLLILVASYVFYGFWDWRFLSLLFYSSALDYVLGLALHHETRVGRRKVLLVVSLVTNLGLLGVFKYYNFFAASLAEFLAGLGWHADLFTLNVILPVGISFYTFQSLSYALDMYRRDIEVTRDFVQFLSFVSFFPHMVAGPIMRAEDLLPQFGVRRRFDLQECKEGLRQMLWGMFKKVVIADNMAGHVETIFSTYTSQDALSLTIGAFLFAIQIYCDFSGYSEIAQGCARLFGIRLMRNFAFPYFSRDIAEFWRRWHISLSNWFRNYLYIPLGGGHGTKSRRLFNVIMTFVISGFWHGANWTFLVWGLLHGLYYIPLVVFGWHRLNIDTVAHGRRLPTVREVLQMVTTFLLVLVSWVFFRSASLSDALGYLMGMCSPPYFNPALHHGSYKMPLVLCAALIVTEWFARERPQVLAVERYPTAVRWGVYLGLALLVLLLGNFGEVDFIYFQF